TVRFLLPGPGRDRGLGPARAFRHDAAVLILLLLFVAGRCLVPMDETDLFFNLRLGEIVLTTGHVPTENLLSFTYPTATDVNLAWLFQVVLALAHRMAGIPGTVLLKTCFVLATWAILFRVAVRRGAHPALAALTLALAAWSAEPRFVERPHLVTFLGLALLLLALEHAEAGRPRLLWGLVPAGLLWTNSNSCFFLAPAALLLYAAGAWLDGARVEARRSALVALALAPLMFATPSGFHCLSYIANHIRMPWLRPLQEYRSARWPLDGPYFFLLAGLAVSLVFAKARPPLRVLFPLLALGVLGGLRIRFVAEFSMWAGPALAVAATRSLPALRGRIATWGTAALLLLLTVVPRAQAAFSGNRWLDVGIEADLIPESAIAFVEKHGLRARMYNDLEVGSYLTWRGWPTFRVFQDPRINGYPDSFHAILRRADLSRGEWQDLLDSFSVDSALLTYPGVNPRAAWFDPKKWALVYRSTDGLVFARRLPERAILINALELPLSFSYSPENGLLPIPLLQRPVASTVPECEWQRRLGDFHRSSGDARAAMVAYQGAMLGPGGICTEVSWQTGVRQALGALALQLGEPAKAASLLEGLSTTEARANHGYALLALGSPAAALADFDAVLAPLPTNDEACFGRGLALEALGRGDEARTVFMELLARSPQHLSAPAARDHLRKLGSPNPAPWQ
ncbi:MAG TPA: tetratricopeptide repeat protein, partial [Polyangia bacterium]